MPTLVRHVDVVAPPAAVWEVLADVRRLPELSAGTVAVRAPERLERRGQTFDQTVELAGRRFTSTWTVVELRPARRLVIEGSVLPGTRYRMTEDLAALPGDRCRFTLTMDYRLPFGPLGRLAGRLGAERRAAEEAVEVLDGVRRLAEAARSHAAPTS
jgi:hypothetical protein